jgi:Tfp pilus assembly protein PilF
MLISRAMAHWLCLGQLVTLVFFGGVASLQAQTNSPDTNRVELIATLGTVEIARAGQTVWDLASTLAPYRRLNPGDQLRTKDRSRATLRLSDLTIVELGPNGHLQLLQPQDRRPGFSVSRGLLHLFHRDKPGDYYFRTPTASPVIRGTEFNLEIAEDGATTLHLLEGLVALTNEYGALDLTSGEAGRVAPGERPIRIAALEANNVIQWRLYYPATLHLGDLQFTELEESTLADSLQSYRDGDLLTALARYPATRPPASNTERIYLAALLLAVGAVLDAEAQLNSVTAPDERTRRLAASLQTVIAAVKLQPLPEVRTGDGELLVSELLARSYHEQSRFALERARESARAAVEKAADFGFGWARLAELEFGFGRTAQAEAAIDRSLALTPQNAQAVCVKGFLLAAQNRVRTAAAQFDRAVALDGALGNAWLGSGLCRIRAGQLQAGLADLVVAVAQEPNRALLRSYLGKAFEESHDISRADRELARAKELDPLDPTAWLYSALLNQRRNQVNEAIRNLERSRDLNDHRQLYRSRLLLDQDRAVQQANLAAMYADAGLLEDSVRAATEAVSQDYANPAAHLFLANSYAQRAGPASVDLRYETATFSEYLVAQLLAPVGGNSLSPYVSQQEYSRLFQSDGFGLSSGTEYRSDGDWRQRAVQSGLFGNFDYALDAYYASVNGDHPNGDYEQLTLSAATRFQITPRDTVFVQAVHTDFESGDLLQYYDPANGDPDRRVQESQFNLFAGWHRAWSPGSHTLLLLGGLNDDFRLTDPLTSIPTVLTTFDQAGMEFIYDTVPLNGSQFADDQSAEFSAGTAELQQIWQGPRRTLIVGGRYQAGRTDVELSLEQLINTSGVSNLPPLEQKFGVELMRASVYAYEHWRPCDELVLIGGVSFDAIEYPDNIDLPPFNPRQRKDEQWSPKAGALWTPTTNTLVRAAWTRSLGGLYYDQSVRLEPAHVAGFAQAFRTLMPVSVGGLLAGAEFETAGVDFVWRGTHGTYFGIGGEWLQSDGSRTVGVVRASGFTNIATNSGTLQNVRWEELALTANLNQLVGRHWSFGARYRLSDVDLLQWMPEVIAGTSQVSSDTVEEALINFAGRTNAALLHQLELSARFTHPTGLFAEGAAVWFLQSNEDDAIADENFWQFNVAVGWRFAQRRAELTVGVLNLTDEDYRLDPVNALGDLPRERTFIAQFKFNF